MNNPLLLQSINTSPPFLCPSFTTMLQVCEFSAGDHFTFCKPVLDKCDNIDCSEEIELREWAKRIEASFATRLGAWTSGMPGSQENHGSQVEDETRWLAEDVHNSEVEFPHLWKSASPATSHTQDAKHDDNRKYLSQNSESREIAKYRKEMLDKIQDVPKYVHELSLRDLVELPSVACVGEESPTKAKEERRKKRGKRTSRSGNVENESFLLKVFLPSPLGGRNNFGSSIVGSKTLPKQKLIHQEKGVPEKNESGRSSRSSSTGSASSSNSRRRKMHGCFRFL